MFVWVSNDLLEVLARSIRRLPAFIIEQCFACLEDVACSKKDLSFGEVWVCIQSVDG